MKQISAQFAPFAARMESEGLPRLFINTFAHYYDELLTGQTGLIPETDIAPVSMVPDMEVLPEGLADLGRAALAHTAIIKLNGGLGTSMGLEKAKSLLLVKDRHSFLDILARQAVHAGVPLLLMNSYSTEDDSLAALRPYRELRNDLPLSFIQHKEPKIVRSDYSPAFWPELPDLEWCPPGHGDIYTALITKGILDVLLEAGYRDCFCVKCGQFGRNVGRLPARLFYPI